MIPIIIILALIWLWLFFFICDNADDGFTMALITIIMSILIFLVSIEDYIGITITGLLLVGLIILFVWIKRD